MKEILEVNEVIYIGNEVIKRFVLPIIDRNNIKNTGEFRDSLEAQTNIPNIIEIWGVDYSHFAVSGRGSGKQPPVKELQKWVQSKFGYGADKAKQVAFAIANKIKKEGTERHSKHLNLIEILESQEVKNYITNEVTKIINKKLQERLIDEMKSIKI